MSLEVYNAKRRFMRTPEPVGLKGVSDPDHLRFVVQYHASKKAHFDLRLELGGVLLSWAVPEGPSLDPKVRRLAIRTEDHPLEYLDFEDEIAAGEYGAGRFATWDQGSWVALEAPDAALATGELKFRLAGKRLSGGWMLKKLPDEEKPWLLIKERDPAVVEGYDIPRPRPKGRRKVLRPGSSAEMPKRIAPQLPSRVDCPPDGANWIHEIKFDGYRTLVLKTGETVRFMTRNGLDWSDRYAALAPTIAGLDCETAVLDGEVAVPDGRGATSLEALQGALSADQGHELVFYAFDLLYLNGHDLAAEPLMARKSLLRRLTPFEATSRIQFSDHVEGDGRALFAQACRIGLEGVVSKRKDAPYRQERSTTWVKSKRFDVAEFDVIGFTTKSSSRHIASLILAEDGVYAGRAGTGLSLDETREWFTRLSALTIDAPEIDVPKTPNAHFVSPGKVSAEISYRGRSTQNVIRHAAILNLRAQSVPQEAPKTKRLITDRDLAAIRLTNPDREMFAGSGTTKLDIALYYARAGQWMLPHLLNRPVTLVRCPSGQAEDCFYQRHGFAGLPDGVETMGDSRDEEFLVIRSAQGFLGLPQFGVIEFHPWDCTVEDLAHPDRMTVDLDPGEDVPWATTVSAAGLVRERLTQLGLTAFLKMTGGRGLHLVVPLDQSTPWDRVAAFLKALAAGLARDLPKLFTDNMQKAKRKERIYVDIARTRFGASAVASYSLRGREGFPAALPMLWKNLSAATEPSQFHRKNALSTIEKRDTDPWADFDAARASIAPKMLRAVGHKD